MPFSKCLRAKIYSDMSVYFDPQGCQTLLLKESDPLLFSLGSWTISILKMCIWFLAGKKIIFDKIKVFWT